MKHAILFIGVALLSTASSAWAGCNYASNAEQMIAELSGKIQKSDCVGDSNKPKRRTRGISTRSLKSVKGEQGNVTIGELPSMQASVNIKIEFDTGSDQIRPSAVPLLIEMATAINSEALYDEQFILGGHTDSDGSDAYNTDLSYRRANAVKSYLVGRHNVEGSRLRVIGFGETTPIKENSSRINKQYNRRVELIRVQ